MNANLLPLTVGGLSLAVSGCYLNKMADNPNIILIMADDLGLNDLGVTGSDYHETPNLDALAKESMIFTNAYSSAPNSAPSRACLMSGLYTPRHGVYTVNPPDRGVDSKRKYIAIANNDTLEPKFKTIAEELKDNGYKNCHIGKWHLGNIGDKTDPLNRGFDINIGGTHAGAPQSHFFPYAGDAGSAERYPGLEKGTDKEYLTDRLTDEAIRFIKNARLKKQPFFLNLSYFAVHYPIQAPEDLVEKYNNKPKGTYHKDPIYAAMTESLDTNVGRILDVIKKSGLDENTVIIFTSDNGGAEPTTDNYQVRGGKGEPYEGGTRVPLFIRWAGKIQSGTTCDMPVSNIDFYPTFCAFAGIKPSQAVDGLDLSKILQGEKAPTDRTLFWHFPAYLESYTNNGQDFRAYPYTSVRKGDWKLIRVHETDTSELYNLKDDPRETTNLAAVDTEKTLEMEDLLFGWIEEVDAPIPSEPNPDYIPQ